ncbi:bifunctional oligoribonuclease/PAP phosphatase NrnA [Proteinivorax tanatarense]|uniref:Bifunctional oligoribonuclease/PAP phosphatase NrnA n=1 Tax=Proteinivorax tanatarense TaxID=1260629 RepID=A0AAU7VQP7_9FIRM
MKDSLNTLINQLNKSSKFSLVAHPGPDGDSIGSIIALGLGLRFLGKTVSMYCTDTLPEQFKFIEETSLISLGKPSDLDSCIIALDCSDEKRLTDQGVEISAFTMSINIDHHPKNTCFADINYCDDSKVATAELIFEILKTLKVPITQPIANTLYLGIVTDSGFFSYENTSSDTHAIASELLESGVNPSVFKQNLEKKSISHYKVLSYFLNNIKLYINNRVAVLVAEKNDLLVHGLSDFQQIDDLVEYLRNIDGVEVAILIKCEPELLKFSFRSTSTLDVGEICRDFGGGGHKKAAGFSLKAQSHKKILADVLKTVEGKLNE